MVNPNQWPSITNLSVWYAAVVKRRITHLNAPVVVIQLWWRHHHQKKQSQIRAETLQNGTSENIESIHRARASHWSLSEHLFAFEKLDGTNLGICYDGTIFGRRQKVEGTSYQRIHLPLATPNTAAIKSVKEAIADSIGVGTLPRLIIYGELMCNAGKFRHYTEQNMDGKWLAFGIKMAGMSVEKAEILLEKLKAVGFLATCSRDNGKITLRLNHRLVHIFEECGIPVVPFIDSGLLADIYMRQKDKMMKSELEGLVLTGSPCIQKWKTGNEDESKGYDILESLLSNYSPTVFKYAGVDYALAQCLAEVAGNKTTQRVIKQKPAKKRKEMVYGANML